MNRREIYGKLATWIILLGVVGVFQNGFAADWGYTGNMGPHDWGSAGYSVCSTGQKQSPINITHPVLSSKNTIAFYYQLSEFNLDLNPHNLYGYSQDKNANYLEFNGKRYQLQSLHFHTPAEHEVNGKHYAMELHLVHQNNEGETLAVGIFIKKGLVNATLQKIFVTPLLDKKRNELGSIKINPAKLLPPRGKYFVYSGSLTTPPCQEDVTWVLLKNPVAVSAEQIQFFKKHVIRDNSRPLQAINKRIVSEEGL